MKKLLLGIALMFIISLGIFNVHLVFSSEKMSSYNFNLKGVEALATETTFPTFCSTYFYTFDVGEERQRYSFCTSGSSSDCYQGMDIFYNHSGEWVLTYQHGSTVVCPFL